jgi:hypothetical protein
MGIESIFLFVKLALWAAGFRLRNRLRLCSTHKLSSYVSRA